MRRAARRRRPGGRGAPSDHRELRPGPVLPEVPQVSAYRVRVPVDQLLGQRQPVERLVPELTQWSRPEDAGAHAGHRRADHQRADQLGAGPGQGLRDPAPDVVPDDDRPRDAERR